MSAAKTDSKFLVFLLLEPDLVRELACRVCILQGAGSPHGKIFLYRAM